MRLAHYPQDPEVYKACDELGLIVWDELPWCRADWVMMYGKKILPAC
ncbi:beta-galactosidase [Nonlabens ulvanivorans]|uniref:Beta-galactosidase n=1 Tax=Nonlabens ulvanivorans TaxID=906888 RepID=A0A081D9H4_NONUL|nr:glycoside hydrolase family 2 TIM barrel-domain containing protein [Nonlabens ulvanivorans]GAK75570.1 beta-galactosidase [Nonlabens ulvanivorans]